LKQLLDHLRKIVPERVKQHASLGSKPAVHAPAKQFQAAAPKASAVAKAEPPRPVPGKEVSTTLVDDPKGKGRRFARYDAGALVGPIVNGDQVPSDKKVGDPLLLTVASLSSDGKQIQFRYVPPGAGAKGTSKGTTPGPKGK
jgi:hypothetical protein